MVWRWRRGWFGVGGESGLEWGDGGLEVRRWRRGWFGGEGDGGLKVEERVVWRWRFGGSEVEERVV